MFPNFYRTRYHGNRCGVDFGTKRAAELHRRHGVFEVILG